MKFPILALLLTALLFRISSTEPATVMANSTAHSQTRCGSVTGMLPHPFMHLRFRGDAMALEVGYRPAHPPNSPARPPVTLRLTIARSGCTELMIRSQGFLLIFPQRSA